MLRFDIHGSVQLPDSCRSFWHSKLYILPPVVGGEARSRNMVNEPPDGTTPQTKWTTVQAHL